MPSPSNPQRLSRFSYVVNNPLRYIDPTGQAPQFPGDPDPDNAPCATDWCWQNRWYEAHGATWNGIGWTAGAQEAHFYDIGIANDVAAEHGLTFVGSWIFEEMSLVLKGVVRLSNAMRGIDQFRNLVGPLNMVRQARPRPWPLKNPGAAWYGKPLFSTPKITFGDTAFLAGDPMHTIILTVHELAHAWDKGKLRRDFASVVATVPFYPTDYAKKNKREWFAESVTVAVFGTEYTDRIRGRIQEREDVGVMLGLSTTYEDYLSPYLTVNPSAIVP